MRSRELEGNIRNILEHYQCFENVPKIRVVQLSNIQPEAKVLESKSSTRDV